MLEYLGEKRAADAVVAAIEDVTSRGVVATPDMGGQATTTDMAEAIAAAVR